MAVRVCFLAACLAAVWSAQTHSADAGQPRGRRGAERGSRHAVAARRESRGSQITLVSAEEELDAANSWPGEIASPGDFSDPEAPELFDEFDADFVREDSDTPPTRRGSARQLSAEELDYLDCDKESRRLKSITDLTLDITAPEGELPRECPLIEVEYLPRAWEETTFSWKASSLCHKPLYFEDVALERYGHTAGVGPFLQPWVSGAHFFGSAAIVPYKMGMYPPWECQYPLGYYRPGSCAPYMLPPVPISLRGALTQAAAVTGIATAIP